MRKINKNTVMAEQGCIEHCTDCFKSAAREHVMWQAFPVPWFGNIEGTKLKFATVGLNPSWTEFVTPAKQWRDAKERLPALMEMSVKSRERISGEQAKQITSARLNYFTATERKPHPWFKNMQGVMSGARMKCAYADGTAVHLDVVACATWQEWGKLSDAAKTQLVSKCFPKFTDTLSKLATDVWLLLDGRTVSETVITRCKAEVHVREKVGENPSLEVWRGKLPAEFGCREFLGWSNPINRQTNQQPLVAWLRRQAR